MTAPATYTPAEIAAALSEAQVRAFRSPHQCSRVDFDTLLPVLMEYGDREMKLIGFHGHTELGLAVLAALDKGVTA